jgi:integrase
MGGAGSPHHYGGSFATKTEALERKRWIDGELAARRVPDLGALREPVRPVTLREVAERWMASRIDVSEGTSRTYATNLDRVLPALGGRPIASITPADVAALVGELHDDGAGLKRESLRKTLSTLGMAFDFGKIVPNPVRDNDVRLPEDDSEEVNPPTADHIVAAYNTIAPDYRLAVLILDATGMRVGELERLKWGDVDEHDRRWRVSRAGTKTRQARWVPVPEIVLSCVLETWFLVRTATLVVRFSAVSLPTRSARRSRGRARRRALRRSAHTTSDTGAARCGTWAASLSPRLPRGSDTRRRST